MSSFPRPSILASINHSYDTDESGAVDREELSAIMTQLGDAPDPEKLNALISEVDEDGDSEIDFQV